jgi:hypothetical protein
MSRKYIFDINGTKVQRISSEFKRAVGGALFKYLKSKDEQFFREATRGKPIKLEIKLISSEKNG